MPYLGILTLKHNILAVKFIDEVVNSVKLIPNKLSLTKRHVNLSSVLTGSGEECKLTNLPEVDRNMKLLRPKTYFCFYFLDQQA
jgi:hypothetical protein